MQRPRAADDRVGAGLDRRCGDLGRRRIDRGLDPEVRVDAARAQALDLGNEVTLPFELVGQHRRAARPAAQEALIAVIGDEVTVRLQQRERRLQRMVAFG